jgi:hypothetical protein
VYSTFNAFATKHPWVAADNIRPKSIAREMFETYQSFPDYVKEYELERAEGLLLRYLSDVYKTLVQTVPLPAKNADLDEIVSYFGAIVRAVDSSLLDEWERMRGRASAGDDAAPRSEADRGGVDVLWDEQALTVLVRNAAFGLTRALARKDWEGAAALLEPGPDPWTPVRIQKAMEAFWAEHTAIRIDPVARGPSNLRVEKGETVWKIEQIIIDPEGDNDWVFRCDVALGPSREAGRPLLELHHLGT